MPISPLHKRKRGKNFLLLAVLGGIIAALYYLTMLKIKGA